jgi:hypothetical protein
VWRNAHIEGSIILSHEPVTGPWNAQRARGAVCCAAANSPAAPGAPPV